MSFSHTATSRTVDLSEKTLKVWLGLRLPPFAGGCAAGSGSGASAGAVPFVSLAGMSAGAFACTGSEWDVVAGWSGGDSVFLLAIAFLSLGTVVDPEPHLMWSAT